MKRMLGFCCCCAAAGMLAAIIAAIDSWSPTPRARAREDVRPSRLSRRGSAGFVVADTPRAARGFCWEMQPLPLFDSTAGYPSFSSSARAQGPVAMANQKGTEGTQRGNRQRFPYEPRVIGGKLLMPAELQAIHRYVLETPVLENVSRNRNSHRECLRLSPRVLRPNSRARTFHILTKSRHSWHAAIL